MVKDGRYSNSTVLESRVLFLTSNPEFYLQCFKLQVVLNMDTQSNPRRALKSAQEQDRRRCRNERDRAQHAAETAEQRSERLRKWRERDRARHIAQTASERQVASQQKSSRLREAHPGVLSDSLSVSLTECVTQNANCAYLCYLPALPQVNSTNIPATTPATSFTPHHSCELLPRPALATHPPHLPPLLQLSALSSHAIIGNHTINSMYTFPHYRNLA